MKPYTPLRDWACPSYDPATGRAASSLHNPADVTIEGERIRPSAQLPHDPGADGGFSWKQIDARRSRSGK
jgi:hypothetical protein